jgi:Protein of unknown function (DUF3489)
VLKANRVAHIFSSWSRMPSLRQQLLIEEAFTAPFTPMTHMHAALEVNIPNYASAMVTADTGVPNARRGPRGDAKLVAARRATKKVTKRSPNEPRATSKTARLIEMLKRPKGATLVEVMAEFGWQVHSTRAIMSAGGSLAKKQGITVISEKVGDSRTYRIAK